MPENLYRVKFGLCCICMELADEGIAYRRMTFTRFKSISKDMRIKTLSEIWLNNARTLLKILQFCARKKIAHYRISSEIFPLATHPDLNGIFRQISDSEASLLETIYACGSFVLENDIGLSFHPSQYVVLSSEHDNVRIDAAREINFNSMLLDKMSASASSQAPINIHLNTAPRKTLNSDFSAALDLLETNARKRLVIENEDKGFWNVPNLLQFLAPFKIPLTFDFLHHKCNGGDIDTRDAFMRACSTWNYMPIFHYAESRDKYNPRAHSDFCKNLPPYYGVEYVCQIEAKMKDLAIAKLEEKRIKKYPI